MAADLPAHADTTQEEPEEETALRTSYVQFDEKLGPTCMMVMMVAALGFLVLSVLYWVFTNWDRIYR
jgi:hypothetical protein